jgi:hypothetical protein
MTAPREAEKMTTSTEMWDHHIVADTDQAVPEAPVADPASSTAEEGPWAPRMVAPADDDQPPEPPIAGPASATEEAGSEPAAIPPSGPPGIPELRNAAEEPGTASGADTDEPSAAGPVPASPSATDGDGIDLDARWHEILAMFVDDPRSSVEHAAAFAGDRAEAFILSITEQRDSLQSGWQKQDLETEALRLALQQYRIFCNRLDELAHHS